MTTINTNKLFEDFYLNMAEDWLKNHGCSKEAAKVWHEQTMSLLKKGEAADQNAIAIEA